MEEKAKLDVLQAHSLRDLLMKVNQINEGDNKILKEDIVTIYKDEDTFFLLYYR